jgi:hypothetical protein
VAVGVRLGSVLGAGGRPGDSDFAVDAAPAAAADPESFLGSAGVETVGGTAESGPFAVSTGAEAGSLATGAGSGGADGTGVTGSGIAAPDVDATGVHDWRKTTKAPTAPAFAARAPTSTHSHHPGRWTVQLESPDPSATVLRRWWSRSARLRAS